MSKDDRELIERLRGLLAKATPVPWEAQGTQTEGEDRGVGIIGLRLDEAGEPLYTPTNGIVAAALPCPTEIDDSDYTRVEANAALLVAAVNNLPALLTRLEALQAQPVGEESGWLIEENASGIIHWIALAENEWPRTEIHVRRARSGRDMMVETDKYRSPVVRVKDANEALRFARKEDAEALIKLFDRFLLCPVATEHMWSAA